MSSNGGSAFPSHGSMGEVAHRGQSLRDHFAGQALVGIIIASTSGPTWEQIAADCYDAAEAMLVERAKREEKDRAG